MIVIRLVNILLFTMLFPIYPVLWLINRLTSQRCPNCSSKWMTELQGEWDGEDWHCKKCGQWWTVK